MGIYEELGVTPIINASGSVTRLGGAPMPNEVLEAFREASCAAVPLEQLQAAASKRIAAATETEAGLVTAGASSALTLGAAAILTGNDLSKMECLPHCEGFPNQFIVAREQRNGYDHAVRAAGARLIEVGFNEIVSNAGVRRTETWEYDTAIGQDTAGILYVYGPTSRPPLEEVVNLAHRRGLSVLVDAAGELPPRSNLKSIPASGADLVAFSGGKSIRGPQSTGILCGRRELISAAAVQLLDMDDHLELWDPPIDFIDKTALCGIPRHGIGRGFKVSKEEIAALLVALQLFNSGAYDEFHHKARALLERILERMNGCAARFEITDKGDGESLPLLEITIDEAAIGKNALQVCRKLRQGEPPIYVSHSAIREGKLRVNPLHLNERNSEVLADKIRQELGG